MILTDRLLRNLSQTNIEPIIVLEIEGVPFLIGSDVIKRYPRYGDPDLVYGAPGLYYGGFSPIANQRTLISLDGTTTSIKQNLNPDKARGSGISQLTVALIDKNQDATKLLAGTYGEVLFKKVKVWISFGNAAWKEDYLLIFRGVIESVSADQGLCKLHLSAPQQKQRQLIAPKVDTELNGAINSSQTTITLESTDNLIVVPSHPLYSPRDPALKTYVKIENEFIEYAGVSGATITGCLRGQLGSVPSAHNDDTEVQSFYLLEGNVMHLALKTALSDKDQTPYLVDYPCDQTNFNGDGTEPDTFFFPDVNFSRDLNVQIGDYIKSSGFINGANNLSTYTEVLDVVIKENGSYILVDAPLVYESGTATGKVTFLSKWNSLGGFGIGMDQDEVDVDEHIRFANSFVSSFDMRFNIAEEIEDAREWIETELYLPAACYSLPSDRAGLSRASVGIHKPPIPGTTIVTLDKTNIVKPETLSTKRSANKYHYNSVAFLYEDSPTDPELRRRVINVVGTQAVKTGNKTLVIESKGIKDFYNAKAIAADSATRLLDRYRTAAEYLDGVQVKFGAGAQIVVGDIVLFDPTDLNIINRVSQKRDKEPLLMEVLDRSVDIKSGVIKLELIETNFDIDARYGLISPASRVVTPISSTKFVISFINLPSVYGVADYRNWIGLNNPQVIIRRPNYSLVHSTRLVSVTSNTFTIVDPCPFAIQVDDIIEFAPYDGFYTTLQQKAIYAYLSDGTNQFADGGEPYLFI